MGGKKILMSGRVMSCAKQQPRPARQSEEGETLKYRARAADSASCLAISMQRGRKRTIQSSNSRKCRRVDALSLLTSGYIPLVIRKMLCLSTVSAHPNLRAISGTYHTGSIAAFLTILCPPGRSIFPSGTSRPAAMASRVSGRSMCAFVTAMVGRMSKPLSRYPSYTSVVNCDMRCEM